MLLFLIDWNKGSDLFAQRKLFYCLNGSCYLIDNRKSTPGLMKF